MDTKSFEELLSWAAPFIQKSSLRKSIVTAQERLCVSLRYFCTGDLQITIATCYRIRPAIMGRIISETCQTILYVLNKKGFIKGPTSKKEYLDIATEFNNKWNFPYCLGVVDRKHVIIQAPPRRDCTFFNYKKSFSIVLFAVCNANYEFILVDTGEAGRQKYGGIYSNSKLGMKIDKNLLNIPEPTTINKYSVTKNFQFVFIADYAFTLKPFMVRPFRRRNELNLYVLIFNYRLSRARRVIDNTLGILASRFRIFRRSIIGKTVNIKYITNAAVILHHFLMRKSTRNMYFPPDYVDQETSLGLYPGSWCNKATKIQGLVGLRGQDSNNSVRAAKEAQNDLHDLRRTW